MITHTSDSHQIQVKKDKVKVTNFKKIAKNSNFARNFPHDTPSEVAW